MPKPTEADKDYFQSLVPVGEGVTVKPMFGNLAAFVNGNMFMGLFGADVGLKLDEATAARLLAHDGAGPFGPEERPMGGYVALPADWRAHPDRATEWVDAALTNVGAQPPKQPKPPKAKAAKPPA